MYGLRAHDLECAREVMHAVAKGSATLDGEPTLDSWEAYRTMGFQTEIPRYHECHNISAMMVIWALARNQYATPQDFIADISTILAPYYLGDRP